MLATDSETFAGWCAGVTHTTTDEDTHLTPARAEPNLHVRASDWTKPEPRTVMLLPPALAARGGAKDAWCTQGPA